MQLPLAGRIPLRSISPARGIQPAICLLARNAEIWVTPLIDEGESANSKESWKSAGLAEEWDLAHDELGQSILQVWLGINREL